MDKSALKKELLKLIASELQQSDEGYKTYHAASMVDRSEPVDIDDQSQAGQAAELAEALGADSQNASEKLAYVDGLDFGPKKFVEEGALVSVDGKHYVIAVSTPQFRVNGKSFIGISPLSPLYKAMDGLGAGDTFTLNGKKQKIDGVA